MVPDTYFSFSSSSWFYSSSSSILSNELFWQNFQRNQYIPKKNFCFDKGCILWLQILNPQISDLSYQCEGYFTDSYKSNWNNLFESTWQGLLHIHQIKTAATFNMHTHVVTIQMNLIKNMQLIEYHFFNTVLHISAKKCSLCKLFQKARVASVQVPFRNQLYHSTLRATRWDKPWGKLRKSLAVMSQS